MLSSINRRIAERECSWTGPTIDFSKRAFLFSTPSGTRCRKRFWLATYTPSAAANIQFRRHVIWKRSCLPIEL